MKRFIILFFILTLIIVVGIPTAMNWVSPAKVRKTEATVKMYSHATGKVVSIPIEEYVIGVVAAEMPAAFPNEALKAQAVAARTYLMKRLSVNGVTNPIHPGADICDDHRHYQAWISKEEMKNRWGNIKYYRYYLKIANAVYSTKQQVITYEGQIIDPVYHSSCGGLGTVDAGEVWQLDAPYLKGVPCPYNADPRPVQEVVLTIPQLEKATGEEVSALPVSTGPKGIIEVLEKTGGGFPKRIRVGSKEFSAAALRESLGLRSNRFVINLEDGQIKISTTGYGHGVGMCQYGAKGMAEKGFDYQEIIKHYYTGVEIMSLDG
jgi:stage II sporulation protein D